MNNMTIFDYMYPKYKITKPIRLIELFSGYGSQALALKYLGIDLEHWKTCEWAVKSIQAYKDIHFPDDDKDYSDMIAKEDLVEILYKLGISSNYNEPMKKEQIKRLSENKLRTIYNNIIATNNLVNIQQVKGKYLEIQNTDKYEYIMTYSFPCQDLSLAGKGKGMSDTSTRSGMLWEVERILSECEELPQILLMENVPQVHSEDNMKDFYKWQLRLEELGYKNYWQDLIATDYGIPQTRNRCFMVSILGDYSYTFPQKQELKLKLKDLLENNVDEKYYLSDKQIESLENGVYNASKPSIKLEITDKGICQTLDTMSGGNRQPLVRVKNFDLRTNNKGLIKTLEENNIADGDYINSYNHNIQKNVSGTITTGVDFRNNSFIAIIKDTENYIEWKEKGKLDIDCRASKEDKVSTTICTTPKNKVLIKNATKQGYLEATDGDGIDISSRMQYHRGTVQKQMIQTIDTQGGESKGVVSSDLRIRKLTPKECFRLMGVKDEDYEKCAKNQSNASLYHLAGDSIVVNVLMAIFKELLKGEE